MRSSRTGSRCWISRARPGATRRWSVPSRRSPRGKLSFSGLAPLAISSPMIAGHWATSCASPKPCLPSTALAIRGTSAAIARRLPRRSSATPRYLLASLAAACHGSGLRRIRRMSRSKPRARQAAPAPATIESCDLPERLLAWYDRHRRDLPWRALPGERPDPYRVWLSEIMLQQTTVATVRGHFDRFMARWPDLRALAAAPLEDVLHAWQGLGYYARARHLHACARAVAERHGGEFPADEVALRALPGIGDYTAAAIAAIAFDLKASPVDGNIERVLARVFAHEEPLPQAKPALRRLAATLTPAE